jgi:hypothetical protein
MPQQLGPSDWKIVVGKLCANAQEMLTAAYDVNMATTLRKIEDTFPLMPTVTNHATVPTVTNHASQAELHALQRTDERTYKVDADPSGMQRKFKQSAVPIQSNYTNTTSCFLQPIMDNDAHDNSNCKPGSWPDSMRTQMGEQKIASRLTPKIQLRTNIFHM